jgi:hypothetical protein
VRGSKQSRQAAAAKALAEAEGETESGGEREGKTAGKSEGIPFVALRQIGNVLRFHIGADGRLQSRYLVVITDGQSSMPKVMELGVGLEKWLRVVGQGCECECACGTILWSHGDGVELGLNVGLGVGIGGGAALHTHCSPRSSGVAVHTIGHTLFTSQQRCSSAHNRTHIVHLAAAV